MLVAIIVIACLVLLYALGGRAWLKSLLPGVFAVIEPIEIALWKKSETLLVGRALWVGGFLVTAYDTLAVFAVNLDWTPLTSRLLAKVPEDMRGLVVSGGIGLLGLLIGWLRKRTTKPLEIVAVPEDAPREVAMEIARVENANAAAVATVADAKAEGKV